MKLEDIDAKLQALREEYKSAAPEKKKFIIVGANILKDYKLYLLNENKNLS